MANQSNNVSEWIKLLEQGNDEAANKIWSTYFPRLVGLARSVLKDRARTDGYEEDIALSALKSFCIRLQDGKFPDINDGDGLWKLLMTITLRKAFKIHRKNARYSDGDVIDWLHYIPNREVSPEDAISTIDEIDRLLELLPDDRTRQIVLARLEGRTQQEVANHVGCSIATVERKLKLVRELWSQLG